MPRPGNPSSAAAIAMRAQRHRQALLARFETLIKRDPIAAETIVAKWEAALQAADGLEGLSS